jgi:hypothetical protein
MRAQSDTRGSDHRKPLGSRAIAQAGTTTLPDHQHHPTQNNSLRHAFSLAGVYGTANYIETPGGRCFSIKLAKASN